MQLARERASLWPFLTCKVRSVVLFFTPHLPLPDPVVLGYRFNAGPYWPSLPPRSFLTNFL